MRERERDKKRNKNIFLPIILFIVFAVVLLGFSYYKSKNVNSDEFSPPNHPPFTTGNPGFGTQTSKCVLSNGNIICADVNDNPVAYHCGDLIKSESVDSDVHTTGNLYCDAVEVHCPKALRDAKAAEVCPTFCPKKTETGTIQTPICYFIAPSHLLTECTAEIYYTCTLQPSGGPETKPTTPAPVGGQN